MFKYKKYEINIQHQWQTMFFNLYKLYLTQNREDQDYK